MAERRITQVGVQLEVSFPKGQDRITQVGVMSEYRIVKGQDRITQLGVMVEYYKPWASPASPSGIQFRSYILGL